MPSLLSAYLGIFIVLIIVIPVFSRRELAFKEEFIAEAEKVLQRLCDAKLHPWLRCQREEKTGKLLAKAGSYGAGVFVEIMNTGQHGIRVYKNCANQQRHQSLPILSSSKLVPPASNSIVRAFLKTVQGQADLENRVSLRPELSALEKEMGRSRSMATLSFSNGEPVTPAYYDIVDTASGNLHSIQQQAYFQEFLAGATLHEVSSLLLAVERTSLCDNVDRVLLKFREYMVAQKLVSPGSPGTFVVQQSSNPQHSPSQPTFSISRRGLSLLQLKSRSNLLLFSSQQREDGFSARRVHMSARARPVSLTKVSPFSRRPERSLEAAVNLSRPPEYASLAAVQRSTLRALKEMWLRSRVRLSIVDTVLYVALSLWTQNEICHCDSHWNNIMVLKTFVTDATVFDELVGSGRVVVPDHRFFFSERTERRFHQLKSSVDGVWGMWLYDIRPENFRYIDNTHAFCFTDVFRRMRGMGLKDTEHQLELPCHTYRQGRQEDLSELFRQGVETLLGERDKRSLKQLWGDVLKGLRLGTLRGYDAASATYRNLFAYQRTAAKMGRGSGSQPVVPFGWSPLWAKGVSAMAAMNIEVQKISKLLVGLEAQFEALPQVANCRAITPHWDGARAHWDAIQRSSDPHLTIKAHLSPICSLADMVQAARSVRAAIAEAARQFPSYAKVALNPPL